MPPDVCPNCGEEMEDDALFCAACGNTLPQVPVLIFCSMCGTRADNPSSRFCARCGSALSPPTESIPRTVVPPLPSQARESWDDNGPRPRREHRVSFVTDSIEGANLLAAEKILRITPCRIRTFTRVKQCALYTTNQRLVCVYATASGVSRALSRLKGIDASMVESDIPLRRVSRTEMSHGTLKVSYEDEKGWTRTNEYVIGSVAQDLGEFILRAREGRPREFPGPVTDEYDDTELKSAVGKGLSVAVHQGARVGAKVTYAGAKVGAKISSQLVKEYLKASATDFREAAEEEDATGWTGRHGPKGRKAEGKVAEALRMTGWRIVGKDVVLQARDVDLVAEKGPSKYLVECKFGKRPIDPAMLDAYVQLYYDSKRSPLGVNGLLFVCPTSATGGRARSDVLFKYPGERIEIIESRNWVRDLERL
ncbi:MAG TPA: zinc ribbon domain-containing protein [Nitrososphaerales archaeon]|nr:zinc ribbon domain-containing protein [Nitrososphaerales archaeon]